MGRTLKRKEINMKPYLLTNPKARNSHEGDSTKDLKGLQAQLTQPHSASGRADAKSAKLPLSVSLVVIALSASAVVKGLVCELMSIKELP